MTPEVKKEVEALAKELNIPVDRFADRVDWYGISAYQQLSEGFIREFSDRVDWDRISMYQRLSEDFIREFSDRVDWDRISACQQLSESFIREFSDRVDGYWISRYQRLSEDFIREFSDRVDKVVQLKKHHTEIDKEVAIQEYAQEHNLSYENGVLTAFRNHDQWGRGSFNKTLSYEPGKYYSDWRCDLDSEEENSFGLGIWPRGNTKVFVKVEDWGVAINRDDGKARVWGFEVASE